MERGPQLQISHDPFLESLIRYSGTMSAADSATYNTNGWSHANHNHPNAASSSSMSYTVAGDAADDMNMSGSNFDQQGWNDTMYNSMNNTAYYPPMINTQTDDQTATQGSATYGHLSLHPTTSMSPSTAHDHFSPSEYASDTAVFGDAFSDYSTPGQFDNTFGDHHHSQFIQNMSSPGGLIGSPEMPAAHNMTQGMNATNPATTTNNTAPNMANAAANQSHARSAAAKAMTPQPRVVVTIDECNDDEINQRIHRRNSSKAHLSPYPDDDSSDEDDDGGDQLAQQNVALISRSQPTASSRAGISPEGRAAVNLEEMPSLDDMEQQHRIEEKNAEVEDWLTHSDIGSDNGEASQPHPRRSKARSRPRAKSTNDSPHTNHGVHGLGVIPNFQTMNQLPGPGITIDVPSEMDEDEEYSSSSEPESPPANIALDNSQGYFSMQGMSDASRNGSIASIDKFRSVAEMEKAMSGITANMAIMRFRQHAKDTDNASVTATLGSRRLSESDIGSVLGSAGISKLLLSPPQPSERHPRRKNSFLGNILPNRNNSNKLKRKNSHPAEQKEITGNGSGSPKDVQTGFAAPKRIGSFGKARSPKIDTAVPSAANDARSPKAVANAASGAIKQIWRSRSRSDLGKPQKGLAELMTQHGGPPIPTLASPLQTRGNAAPQPSQAADGDSGDEDGGMAGDGLTMELAVRTDMHIIPTHDGFKYQVRELNPRLQDFLLDRVTQEQVKRYKRLVDMKLKHNGSITAGSCSSKAFCFALGGQAQELPPRAGNKDPDNALVGFQIMRPGMTEDDLGVGRDGQQMVPAQFPSGVPLPPVSHLPAEFECPLCFKVKKFYKPSDWTKHVHEDVQPFTCTFPNCNEPKSFKRKADWVRHENERHRQLESWVCSVQDCNHTCYRKDNFVQHLVREHKVPEPRIRTARAAGAKSPLTPFDGGHNWQNPNGFGSETHEDVWALVDKCHKDSTKLPKDEPCKFCGNICTSWKKLTVHLAKHMEQISMPVLPLVEQKRTTTEYMNQRTQNMPQPMHMNTKPMNELPVFLCDEPTSFEAEPQSMLGIDQGLPAGMIQTYPPMNMALQAQMAANTLGGLTASNLSMAGGSYPPPSLHSHSRGSSFTEQDYAQQQGTTYPPVGMHSRTLSAASSPQFEHGATNVSAHPMYLQQPGMFMQEPMSAGNVYLTPTSNTPVSLGYSPTGSTHSLHQTYGFHSG